MKHTIISLLLAFSIFSSFSQTSFESPMEDIFFQDEKIHIIVDTHKMSDIDLLRITVSRGESLFETIWTGTPTESTEYVFKDNSYIPNLTQRYKVCFTYLGTGKCVEPVLIVPPYASLPSMSLDENGYLLLYSKADTSEQFFFLNMAGQTSYRSYYDLTKGLNRLKIPRLPAGRYFIRNQRRGVFSFIIQ